MTKEKKKTKVASESTLFLILIQMAQMKKTEVIILIKVTKKPIIKSTLLKFKIKTKIKLSSKKLSKKKNNLQSK